MDSDLETLLADERRLKQMLVNLLSNAVKFTPENGHIGLEVRGDRESHSIRFMVWDTGIGIKQEDQARLFKPFIQVNASMTREAGGTGLGLALVSQMAKLHGGSIKLDSVPGQGSRFTITLPWDNGTSRTDAQEQHTGKEAQPRKKSSSAGRQTILLVEDTEAVVMVVRDYLEFAGYNVEVAYSARDGIALARKVQPDLILMDVQMPGMDGLEATRILRGQEDFKTTPIIALTAFAMQSDRERSLAAGMNEHISKPVNLKDLVETIRSYLKGSQS
jgi:CheY-like chemotaxis protein